MDHAQRNSRIIYPKLATPLTEGELRGLIGALCAAVPGVIDLIYYKGGTPTAKKVALTHMTINLIVVARYAINVWAAGGRARR